jgi:hypothetical protein
MNIEKEIFSVIFEATQSGIRTEAESAVYKAVKLDVSNSVSVSVMLAVSDSLRNYVQEYHVGKVMNEYEY